MATLLKVLNNLADIKSAGGVALGLGTQGLELESRTEVAGVTFFPLSQLEQSSGVKELLGRAMATPELLHINAAAVLEYEVDDWLVSQGN
jgi:hypothetical protein